MCCPPDGQDQELSLRRPMRGSADHARHVNDHVHRRTRLDLDLRALETATVIPSAIAAPVCEKLIAEAAGSPDAAETPCGSRLVPRV